MLNKYGNPREQTRDSEHCGRGKPPVNKHEVMDDILNIAGENVKEERDDQKSLEPAK